MLYENIITYQQNVFNTHTKQAKKLMTINVKSLKITGYTKKTVFYSTIQIGTKKAS